MNLYAWRPIGHGPTSFFVMAANEAEAKVAVQEAIAVDQKRQFSFLDQNPFDGASDYELTVVGSGEVLLNDND